VQLTWRCRRSCSWSPSPLKVPRHTEFVPARAPDSCRVRACGPAPPQLCQMIRITSGELGTLFPSQSRITSSIPFSIFISAGPETRPSNLLVKYPKTPCRTQSLSPLVRGLMNFYIAPLLNPEPIRTRQDRPFAKRTGSVGSLRLSRNITCISASRSHQRTFGLRGPVTQHISRCDEPQRRFDTYTRAIFQSPMRCVRLRRGILSKIPI